MNRTDATGRFKVEFRVSNNEDRILARNGALDPGKVRSLKIQGVVDSGATRLVLPASVVKKLGLASSKQIRVRYADRRVAVLDAVPEVHVELQGRDGNFTAAVQPGRRSALIGAIVLEDLDFLADCMEQKLVPRDPKIVVSEIE